MPSKKPGKAGAPFGNMSACKPQNRFRTWMARRALRPEDRVWLGPLLSSYQDALLSDRATEPSQAERRLIELAMLARGGTLLILDALKARPTDGSTDQLVTLLSAMTRTMALERSTLSDLGLKRETRAIDVRALLAENVTDAETVAQPV
jgi:hypothetical protein